MARAKRETTPANLFRFMPGRDEVAEDGKMFFQGLRYEREAFKDPKKGVVAGVGIGPGGRAGKGFKLSKGGIIIPAEPNDEMQTVDVREYTPPADKGKPEQKKRSRLYVDMATIEATGQNMARVIPCNEEDAVYVEIWTGIDKPGERAYILRASNMLTHGSVAYSGGSALIAAKDQSDEAVAAEEGVRNSKALKIAERHGKLIAGVYAWTATLWKLRFSAQDSEVILVRQLDRFFFVMMRNGQLVSPDVPAAQYASEFERLRADDLIADSAKAEEAIKASADAPALAASAA